MTKKRKLYIIPLVIGAALLLSACGSDDKNEDTSENSSSRVRVIGTENDQNDEDTNDFQEFETEDETVVDDEEVIEDSEDEVTSPVVTDTEGTKSLDGATADDGVTINTYAYGYSGGKLEFVWGFGGGDENPATTAGYDADGNIVVTFTSLKADALLKDGTKNFELGDKFPSIKGYREVGSPISTYVFEVGESNEFDLKVEDKQIVVTINL